MKKFSRYTAVLVFAVLMAALFAGCRMKGILPFGSQSVTPPESPSASPPATPGAPGWGAPSGSPTEATAATTPASGDNVVTTAEYSFTLPAGFTDNGLGVYYAPDYPNDASNITVFLASPDPRFSSYTSKTMEEMLEEVFCSAMEQEVDIEMLGFAYTTVSGKAAIRSSLKYTLYGVEVYQMQCAVQTDSQAITITYTQVLGRGWEEAFEESINSIVIY